MMNVKIDGKDIVKTQYHISRILLDTNLLVFANHKGSPFHLKASCILIASLQGDLKAYLSSQNLLEFYSVMTNSTKVKPSPRAVDISRICLDFLKSNKITKIHPTENAATVAVQIASEKGLRGARIFDCFLAVTAQENQLDRIWTDNVSDLNHFAGLHAIVENPLEMDWEIFDKQDRLVDSPDKN